jgi:phosphoribosylglycinamide formyltransferase-1
LRLGVLISGRGSNLQALIDAARDPSYPAEIALVISNRAEAAGLARATDSGIATCVVPHRGFATREDFDRALDRELKQAGIGLVCLAGFMRLLSPWFAEAWRDRLINIHPSLLPAFKGLDAQAQALAAGVRIAGCTVHFVRPEMDSGPIIVQAAVPVLPGDDEAALSARILSVEHLSYKLAVRLIAEGRVAVDGDVARIRGEQNEAAQLVSPTPISLLD